MPYLTRRDYAFLATTPLRSVMRAMFEERKRQLIVPPNSDSAVHKVRQ